MFLFCLVFAMFCARLFICALWSPAGKGLTSWLSFVVSTVSLSLSQKLFVAFPWVETSTGPGGFMICVFINMTGTPEGSTESGFMEKPGIEPATPGLQGIALIHYTTGQVWYLIVSIPDLCTLTYFYMLLNLLKSTTSKVARVLHCALRYVRTNFIVFISP